MRLGKIFIACLIGFSIIGYFREAEAISEESVIHRYDFSSPLASWNSLQKAVREKDPEGVAIHLWQIYKNAPASSHVFLKSFEEFAAKVEMDKDFFEYAKLCVFRFISKSPAFNSLISHLKFIKELERESYDQGMGKW